MNIYYFGICILFYHSLKQIFGARKLILEWQYNVPFKNVIVSQMLREVMSDAIVPQMSVVNYLNKSEFFI